jgi:hypothetical protein
VVYYQSILLIVLTFSDLHDRVMQNKNNMNQLEHILRTVTNIRTFNQLKESSVSLLLPVIHKWLVNKKDTKAGMWTQT